VARGGAEGLVGFRHDPHWWIEGDVDVACSPGLRLLNRRIFEQEKYEIRRKNILLIF
jgi:hypothetical protein